MDVDFLLNDRRRFDRYIVKSNVFALFGPNSTALGKIIDISIDGLSYSTTDSFEIVKNLNELDIFVHGEGFYLYRVPIKTVENGLNSEVLMGKVPLTRCCIQFDNLRSEQKKSLDLFINDYTFNLN